MPGSGVGGAASYNVGLPSLPDAPTVIPQYLPRRVSRSEFIPIRGLRYHVRIWEPAAQQAPTPAGDEAGGRGAIAGEGAHASPGTLVMLHGWMDVSASFQFLVDALQGNWRVIAPDWRGFGLTERPAADCYWFPDYLADLEFLLDALGLDEPVNLVAHSMGANAAMLFAGVRPARVRRLVNLEGLGMPGTQPEQAPERYAQWIDELKAGSRIRDYDSREAVAARLMRNNARLRPEFAGFLAQHWSIPTAEGRFALAGDPAHKVVNAQLYRVEEIMACWRRISAPVLLVFADADERWQRFRNQPDYGRRVEAIPDLRIVDLPDCGHMLHHDQPVRVAELIEGFVR